MSHPLRPITHTLLTLGLLLVGLQPVVAQSIPPKGAAATLDVATWNIEWFGSSSNGPADEPRQLTNVRAIIEEAGLDLWAVQEIADEDAFEALLEALGDGYDGRLATNSGTQRIGFIFKTDVIHPRNISHILTKFEYAFAYRPPLQLDAEVTLPDTTVQVTFIVLHMKAHLSRDSQEERLESYERRVDAAGRLKSRIDVLMANDAVVVLGDFNDQMTESIAGGRPSPYLPFLEDTDDYRVLTYDLEQQGDGTYCENGSCSITGSFLDHILITDELFTASADARRLTEVSERVSNYAGTTSDHLPVYVSFAFSRASASTPKPVVHAPLTLEVFPHPFHTDPSLRLTLPAAGRVRIRIVDLLGREVASVPAAWHPAGPLQVELPARHLAAGMYLLHIQLSDRVLTRPVIKGF